MRKDWCALKFFFLSLIYVLNLYGDVLYVSESFDENDKKKVLNLIPYVYVWPRSLVNCLDQFLTGAETQTNASGCPTTTTTTTTIAMHCNH